MGETDDCTLCGLVGGRLPRSVVSESDTVLALMDIDPVTPGHVLVLPKRHLPGMADLTDDLGAEMISVARRVAAAIRRTDLRCEGVNLFLADGAAASQEVFHSHLHVFARYPGDGFDIRARWGSNPSRAELDAIASAIRAEVDADRTRTAQDDTPQDDTAQDDTAEEATAQPRTDR